MKLTLETRLRTLFLLMGIILGISAVLFLLWAALPSSNPTLFWVSFFLPWFAIGFIGIIWVGDDQKRASIYYTIVSLVVVLALALAHFYTSLSPVVYSFEGLFAGMAAAGGVLLIKRGVDRMRGLSVQPSIPFSPIEKDLAIMEALLILVMYYWTIGFFLYNPRILDPHVPWILLGILLGILWVADMLWILFRWNKRL